MQRLMREQSFVENNYLNENQANSDKQKGSIADDDTVASQAKDRQSRNNAKILGATANSGSSDQQKNSNTPSNSSFTDQFTTTTTNNMILEHDKENLQTIGFKQQNGNTSKDVSEISPIKRSESQLRRCGVTQEQPTQRL